MRRVTIERTRFQGKELTCHLQAPTLLTLNSLISGMRSYASAHGMGTVKILQKGRDPDGGFKAIVTAHNINIFRWIKRRIDVAKIKARHRKERKTKEEARKYTLAANKLQRDSYGLRQLVEARERFKRREKITSTLETRLKATF